MSTVLDALRKAESGSRRPIDPYAGEPPPGPPRRRGPRLLWLVLGGIALVVAFVGGIELSGTDSSDEATTPTEEVASVPEPPEPAGGTGSGQAAKDSGPVQARPATESVPEEPVPAPEPPAGPSEAVRVAGAGDSGGAASATVPATAPGGAPAEPRVMSEKRRRALERVMARRAEREERRESRTAARSESREMREAIRSTTDPDERAALLEEFRERRRVARAERRAEQAEERLEVLAAVEAGRVPVAGRTKPAAGPAAAPAGTDVAPAPPARPEVVPAEAARPEAVPAEVAPAAPVGEEVAPAAPVQEETPPDSVTSPTVVAMAPGADEGLRRPPSSAPAVRINVLQWSSDPVRRFAYVSVDGNPAMTQVREGESYQGLTVKRILPSTVEFAHEGTTFVLRAN